MRSYHQPPFSDDEFSDLTSDERSTRIQVVPGAIELLGDQFAKPAQDCLWPGGGGHQFESSTSESFAVDG